MTSFRRFVCDDLLKFTNVNLDRWTETFNLGYYLSYLAQWPEYFTMATSAGGDSRCCGYIMGKVEETGPKFPWHGHVTAVTVAPEYRRRGLARQLMLQLETVSERTHNAWFVDLFVRASNASAIGMYEQLGYTVYRRVLEYYGDDEDALDMRKALPRDVHKTTIVPLPHPVHADETD
jgi:N-terminal acetyltransferase B complex catalytic subunit